MNDGSDDSSLAVALRHSLQGDAIARPGLLRVRLADALGEVEAVRLRAIVHQLVAAAEEHLPASLAAAAPMSSATVVRLGSDLAKMRGWTPEVGQRVTRIWAEALGLPSSGREAEPPTRLRPTSGRTP